MYCIFASSWCNLTNPNSRSQVPGRLGPEASIQYTAEWNWWEWEVLPTLQVSSSASAAERGAVSHSWVVQLPLWSYCSGEAQKPELPWQGPSVIHDHTIRAMGPRSLTGTQMLWKTAIQRQDGKHSSLDAHRMEMFSNIKGCQLCWAWTKVSAQNQLEYKYHSHPC